MKNVFVPVSNTQNNVVDVTTPVSCEHPDARTVDVFRCLSEMAPCAARVLSSALPASLALSLTLLGRQ